MSHCTRLTYFTQMKFNLHEKVMPSFANIFHLALPINGKVFSWIISYYEHDREAYEHFMNGVIDEIYSASKPSSLDEWKCQLDQVGHLIFNLADFWLKNIFLPLRKRLQLPKTTVCHCSTNTAKCRFIISRVSFHDQDKPKWVGELSSDEVRVRYNTAFDSPEDVEYLLNFYESTITAFYQQPQQPRCCPLSMNFIQGLETFRDVTQTLLYEATNRFHM